MPKLFNLFIHQPFSRWTLEFNYGDQLAEDAGRFADHVRLVTDLDDAFVFASCSGELSVSPPVGSSVGFGEVSDELDQPLPETLDLWLVMSPLATLVSDLVTGLQQFTGITGPDSAQIAFTYYNVDLATFREDVRELLRLSTVPPADPNADDEEISKRMILFLKGQLSLFVDAGTRIGKAGSASDPAAAVPFEIGFGLTTSLRGPGNPHEFVDRMKLLIEEDADVPDLLVLIPGPPNAFSTAGSKTEAIQMTSTALYNSSDLESLRTDWGLTRAEWRVVGNNQKALYRTRLLARYDLLPASTSSPAFEFSQTDPDNLFQLEAVVEFFANFTDPWVSNAVPIDVSPTDHSNIDRASLVIEGSNATLVGSGQSRQIKLDGSPDLTKVKPFHHFIYLSAGNPVQSYRITAVTAATKQLTAVDCNGNLPPAGVTALGPWRIELYTEVDFIPVSGDVTQIAGNQVTVDVKSELKQIKTLSSLPNVDAKSRCLVDGIIFDADPGRMYLIDRIDQQSRILSLRDPGPSAFTTSAWRISHVPILVMVDPIGPRLKGTNATVLSPGVVQLADTDLKKVNVGGAENIFLAGDSGRGSRTYRIVDKDEVAFTLTLDGIPSFANSNSEWHIPAGIGGAFNPFQYKLGPKEVHWPTSADPVIPAGFDHYDGMMFVVDNGKVVARYRWTSYTSRSQFGKTKASKVGSNRRSIRGNHRYEAISLASTGSSSNGSDYRNYCFKINDRFNDDNVFPQARNYFDGIVPEDGQQQIRFHYGNKTSSGGTGSAGCNVSPEFYEGRKSLIGIYQRRYAELLGTPGQRDADVDLLEADHNKSTALQKRSFAPIPDGEVRQTPILLAEGWTHKIFCYYWLVRPDERPAP